MKQTTQSTNSHEQSELRFVLVNGLLKTGVPLVVLWFLCRYLIHFGFSEPNFKLTDFWNLAYTPIIGGAVVGLWSGLFRWHQNKKNSK